MNHLLQAAAKLRILATSRKVLNVDGEREWPVLPLSTPTCAPLAEAAWSMQQLQPFAAVQLFSEKK